MIELLRGALGYRACCLSVPKVWGVAIHALLWVVMLKSAVKQGV